MAYLPSIPPLRDADAVRALGVSNHIKRHGIPATARVIGVERETLTDWSKRYSRYVATRLSTVNR